MSKEAYAEAYESLQKANTELRNLVNKEQQLTSQLHENTMVKEELDALREGEHVYKLHGNVLIRQDTSEARTTVGSRLKLINQEMLKTERNIKEAQEKQETIRRKLGEMQAKLQAAAQAAAAESS